MGENKGRANQCVSCIHREVCKYREDCERFNPEYAPAEFVQWVCRYYERGFIDIEDEVERFEYQDEEGGCCEGLEPITRYIKQNE